MIVYLITTLLFANRGLCNVNIAINKPVIDCNGLNYQKLVDGRMDTSDTVTKMCREDKMKIYINVQGLYLVHYVNLVDDECTETHVISFEVNLVRGNKCGRYLDMLANCSNYRVNCIGVIKPSNTVVIELDAGPLHLKEIEVFTLAPDSSLKNVMIYYGCFKDFHSESNSKKSNKEECRKYCSTDNYLFAAIEGQNCHCSFAVNEDLRAFQVRCRDGCYPGDEDCSKDDKYYSVYRIRFQLPARYSCIDIFPELSQSFTRERTSVEECLEHCDNSQFALVLNLTITAIQCSCDNGTFDKSQPDNYRRCGRTTRHLLAYTTCFDGTTEKTKCSNLLANCKNGWNWYGDCIGGCKRGFVGKQCLEKVPISCDLGPCPKGTSKCIETYDDEDDDDGINDFNCTCNLGYIQVNDTACIAEDSSTTMPDTTYTNDTSDYSFTDSHVNVTEDDKVTPQKDTDASTAVTTTRIKENLCYFKNECTPLNTRCIITGSTFKCICEEGYTRNDSMSDCHDIDECNYGPCNLVRSTCINQEGTFKCFCKKGYVETAHDTCSIDTKSSVWRFDATIIRTIIFLILIPLIMIVMLLGLRIFIVHETTESSSVSSHE